MAIPNSSGGNELIDVLRELVDAIRENTGAMKPGIGAVGGGGAGAGGDGGAAGGGGGGRRRGGGGGGPDSVSQLAEASGLMRMGTLGFAVGALDAGVRTGVGGGNDFSLMGFQQGLAGAAEDLLANVPVLGTLLGATRGNAVRHRTAAQLEGVYGDLAAAGQIDPSNLTPADMAGLRETGRVFAEQQTRRFNMQERARAVAAEVTNPGESLADAPGLGVLLERLDRGLQYLETIANNIPGMGGGQAR